MTSFEMLERNARRAKEVNSFGDYIEGSATSDYKSYCEKAEKIAQQAKDRLTILNAPAERIEKVEYLLFLYKTKKLTWLNDLYANRARVPSIMIAGPANFPTRAKEKQLAREDTLMRQNPDYIIEEIQSVKYNAGTIYSDDENAVERIKAKIESLKGATDPYGNKSAEIRRLKERLLQLAPEEFAEQQANIAINSAKTYAEIVALWNSGKITSSQYNERREWYYNLFLDFTDGKRHYKEMLSIEVDENGGNRVSYNLEKRANDLIPLTDEQKYSLVIGCIYGSGNKAIIYRYLKSLSPKAQAAKAAEEAAGAEIAETVTINGETAQIIRNKKEMRLQLIFDGKPSDKTREILKSNGFRWAPSCSAWQRLLNSNSEYTLKNIISK